MNRREQWRKALDFEVERLLVMPYPELVSVLRDRPVYEIAFDSKNYQVEMELLENAASYIQVMVAVDDGDLPAAALPVTRSFIRDKPATIA